MLSLSARPTSPQSPRVNSSAWVMTLKQEISEPDQPHTSVFDDADEDCNVRFASDESRITVLAHVAASVDRNLSGMSTPFEIMDAIRQQSWEYLYRESSLVVASTLRPQQEIISHEVVSDHTPSEGTPSGKRKATSPLMTPATRPKPLPNVPQKPPEEDEDDAVTVDVVEEDIRAEDILGGRGGLSNHHVGNKRFRQIVAEMKNTYRATGVKTDKTALARAIVEYVQNTKGGRFLIKKPKGQVGWRVMTTTEARKKTSQALRETKELKWIKEDKSSP